MASQSILQSGHFMMEIQHINCGWLHSPPTPPACCHCLLIYDGQGAVLIDTGIGVKDAEAPSERIGQDAINAAGFQFIPVTTAASQLEQKGISRDSVTDIVLTHCDPDHVGGLADFPNANIHLSVEEKANLDSGSPRYSLAQFSHGPRWTLYGGDDSDILGIPSRKIVTSLEIDIRLVPLFGHTLGHCGIGIADKDLWKLHIGDAYYLRDELTDPSHPIDELATLRADDDQLRRDTLERLRAITRDPAVQVSMFGYHDTSELPKGIPLLDEVA